MMAMLEWDNFGLGLVTGTVASLLFFGGLAVTMHLALKRENTTVLLLISAAVRIALLFWLGSWVVTLGSAAIVGFAMAFVLMRFTIIALVRPRKNRETAQWS